MKKLDSVTAEALHRLLQEPESTFRTRLLDYTNQHARLVSEWRHFAQEKGLRQDLDTLLLAPPRDPEVAEDLFRKWRHAVVARITELDNYLPQLQVKAKQVQCEVDSSLQTICGFESIRAFMHQAILRRFDSLMCQRVMLQCRLRCHSSPALSSTDGSAKLREAAESSLALIDKELRSAGERVSHLNPSTNSPVAAHPASSAAMVLVRQVLLEDVSTRTLHRFLTKLQYFGLSHRSRLWRRSLEFRAIMELPKDGTATTVKSSVPQIPLGIASRRSLDHLLVDLGAAFGCGTSLQSDKGKTFALQVANTFTRIFEQQQRNWEFRAYPVGTSLCAPERVGAGWVGQLSARHTTDSAEDMDEAYFLRPSDWIARAPWCARVDPDVMEQGVLLKMSFSAGYTPSRLHHGETTHAFQCLEHVVEAGQKPADCCPPDTNAWEPDIDSILLAERDFAEVGDIKLVVRRLEAAAGSVSGVVAGAAGEATEERNSLPVPLVRAYYMLRHLHCRAFRWRLLGYLNFFRFLQRRLVAGLDEAAQARHYASSGSAQESMTRSARLEERVQEKTYDLSAWKLAGLCRQFSLPFASGDDSSGTNHLDPEHCLRPDNEHMVVSDEAGRRVLHSAAVEDLASLEREMLSIGSYYIHKFERATRSDIEQQAVDRGGVLFDLYAAEVRFNSEKQDLLETYLEIYEHTTDQLEKQDLAQRIIDVLAVRPRLDLEDIYFTEAYTASICLMNARAVLLRNIVKHQVKQERASTEEFRYLSSLSPSAPRASVVVNNNNSDAQSQPQPLDEDLIVTVRGDGDYAEVRASDKKSASRYASSCDSPGVKNAARFSSGSGISNLGGFAPEPDPVLSYAHQYEGYGCGSVSSEDSKINLTPRAEPVFVDEFCSSASLTWKAEVMIEEVHKDLVEHFRPPSALAVTLLARACFSYAAEIWRAEEDETMESGGRDVHEDPELLLTVVFETVCRLSRTLDASRETLKETLDHSYDSPLPECIDKIGGLELNGFLHYGFMELRRGRGKQGKMKMAACMLVNLLEHTLQRRSLRDSATAITCLEKTLREQADTFGVKLDQLRPAPRFAPLRDAETLRADVGTGAANNWINQSAPTLSAGMLHADLGLVELETGRALAFHCSPMRIQEMRYVCQHELAYRALVLGCVHSNALLLDAQYRQKNINEIVVGGPARDMVTTDIGHPLLWKFRMTAELSGALRKPASRQQARKELEIQPYVDMSRYQALFQTPAAHVGPVMSSAAQLLRERNSDSRKTLSRQAKNERQKRLLWFQALACSSQLILRSTCELYLRVQAVHQAMILRSVTALIPSKLTPFENRAARKHPFAFMDRDGIVGNIFAVPGALDTMQLRGAQGLPDIPQAMAKLFSHYGQWHYDSQRSTRGGADIFEILATAHQFEKASPQVYISFDCPAFSALAILHELTGLVIMRYALAMVDGDPGTLLRMQRSVRFDALAELDETNDPVGSTLSRTEPTFEALEELCANLAQIALRMDALGDSAKDASEVRKLLRVETRAAHRQLALLLRCEARELQRGGALDSFTSVRRWICVLETGQTCPSSPVPAGVHVPLASLDEFAAASVEKDVTTFAPDVPYCNVGSYSWANAEDLATTTVNENGLRYVAEFRPDTLRTHRFLDSCIHALLGDIATYIPSSEGAEARQIRPYVTLIPWQQPPTSIASLTAGICRLPFSRRRQLSNIRRGLAAKRGAFHELRKVKPHSNAAAEADAELFGTLLLFEILKEGLVYGEPTFVLPAGGTRSATLKALGGATCCLDSAGVTEAEEAKYLREGEVELAAQFVGAQMEVMQRQCAALVGVMYRMLEVRADERLGRELATVAELRLRARASGSAVATANVVAHLDESYPGLYATKLDSLLHALNRLRGASTYVLMDPHGLGDERAHVLREQDVNACVEELMGSLTQWGTEAVQGREQLAEELLTYFRSQLERLRQRLHLQEVSASLLDLPEGSGPSRRKKDLCEIDTEVADKGCRLVFEVDRLHRLIRNLKVVSREIEYRLSSEVWEKVRTSIASITGAITSETGRFKEAHKDREHFLASRMREIREHTASEFAGVAAKTYELQLRASRGRQRKSRHDEADHEHGDLEDQQQHRRVVISNGMYQKYSEVARRDDVRLLHLRIDELSHRQTCARFFHIFKCQAMRQKFEEQMKSLRMTLESNRELSERLAQASHQDRTTIQSFIGTAREISLVEQKTEELHTRVEADTDHRQRLESWKKHKTVQLTHLDATLKEHQRTGTTDVESMMHEINVKTRLVRQLEQEREKQEAVAQTTAERSSNRTGRQREKLIQQRKVKYETHQDLVKLRKEVEQGGMSDAERLRLWRSRVAQARQRLAELREEHRRLEMRAAAASP